MKNRFAPSAPIAITLPVSERHIKTLIFFLLLAFSVFAGRLFGQSKPAPVFSGYHKNIYMELLGSSVGGGVSFDMRLNRGRMDGIGFRAGIGGIHVSGTDFETNNYVSLGIVTFPVEFNNLVGKRRSSFEAGIGLLPVYGAIAGQGEITNYEYVQADGFALAGGYLTFGYRLQPLRNGFMMNFKWNPMFLRGAGFTTGWFGLGLGFGFK